MTSFRLPVKSMVIANVQYAVGCDEMPSIVENSVLAVAKESFELAEEVREAIGAGLANGGSCLYEIPPSSCSSSGESGSDVVEPGTRVGTGNERVGSFGTCGSTSKDKPIPVGWRLLASSSVAFETIQEGDGGMKVLRVDPGIRSLVGCAGGDAVKVLGSTNSYLWKSGVRDKLSTDRLVVCTSRNSGLWGTAVLAGASAEGSKIGIRGEGFLKVGSRRVARRSRLTPVLNRLKENMLSQVVPALD